MEAKKDNVIHFPGRRPEGSNSDSLNSMSQEPQSKGSQRPWLKGALTISGIAVLSMVVNGLSPSEGQVDQASSGRGIASVDERKVLPEERDTAWEKSLANDLSKRGSRELASLSLGRRPSPEDRLRFGTLKSQYAVVLQGGRLAEVRWPANQSPSTLVYLENPEQFLEENRELLPAEFHVAIPESDAKGSEGHLAKYALLDGSGRKIASAEFGLDPYGRLLALSISDSTSGQ